ncbi:hypothetical protein [Motilibacter aurantiacus]|uniref:hypothetical protein n=1 Tax=Motilibacter aurantiacus TaxID=2714955 RepID=UPI00140BAF59|nr:hypothetical protein [Motilibacter aurantiacus]NHC44349.1 hypothetical protein [Motilibacter aurantiacus]
MTTQGPRSLLFLSCDIVGSTRFKQQQGNLWQKTFLSFYREFPQMLGELTREAAYTPGFTLWKPVGDELIFTSEVRSEKDVYAAVRIWLNAMQSYEENVLNDVSLATKGGAFIATFPGPDSESSIPRDPLTETSDKGVVELNDEALASRSPEYLFDYFGPSIDTGFRVLSACSQRYFTLSVEVAWAMAQCDADAGVNTTDFPLEDLLLLETREFKGVWDGREYPLFALDRHHLDLVNVALARIRNQKLAAWDVVNLCKECSAKANWPSKLFLPDSEHLQFKAQPVDSLAALRSNSMEGAETVPVASGGESLRADAPLGGGTPPPTPLPSSPESP